MLKKIIDRFNSPTILFVWCFCLSFLIFLIRNPDPLFNLTFYAEDGNTIISYLLTSGFWKTLFILPLHYYIFGHIILAELALILNVIFHGGNIFFIPEMFAIVSYAFFALISTVHIIVLRNMFPAWFHIMLFIGLSFVPLPYADYEVIGRILNVGFAFVYFSLMITFYRVMHPQGPIHKFLIIDFLLLINAGTNPVAIFLLPLIFIPYIKMLIFEHISLVRLIKMSGFFSALILSAGVGYMILNMLASGSPWIAGYNNQSMHLQSVIEMLFARSMLFPMINPLYQQLNDLLVIALFIFLIILFVIFSQKKHQLLYAFSFYSLIVYTVALAVFRPGLSTVLNNYSVYGPSRHYYGANLMAIFLLALLVYDMMTSRYIWLRRATAFTVVSIFLIGVPTVSNFGKPFYKMSEVGTFKDATIRAIHEKKFVDDKLQLDVNGKNVLIQSYPADWTISIPKDLAIKSLQYAR